MRKIRNKKIIAESTQEQAVASWTNYLNQLRINTLFESLTKQDQNFELSMKELDKALHTIDADIIANDLGNWRGMHGFIAEVAECGVGNARNVIVGKAPNYVWLNDNSAVDIVRDGVNIQQKFSASGNHLSLAAIQKHYEKYPDFLTNGAKYQIPEDHYNKIKELLSISEEQANKLPTSTGEFSLKQWRYVHDYFNSGDIRFEDIEPSKLTYAQVQKDTIHGTLQAEKENIQNTDSELRKTAFENSQPTLQEGIKVTAGAAVIEGGFTFASAIISKVQSGKHIREFTEEDWLEIAKQSGVGTLKGGIRGASIYALTNYTATPAAVASALVTASFGIAQQAYLYRSGTISKEQFLINSEIVCVDVTVSAASSLVGQTLIPIPVLGAVIGNAVGMLMYQTAKEALGQKARRAIQSFVEDMHRLDMQLDEELRQLIEVYNHNLDLYFGVLEKAFAVNAKDALDGSIQLAKLVGVKETEILKSTNDVDAYFLQ